MTISNETYAIKDFSQYVDLAIRTAALQTSDWYGATSGSDVNLDHAELGVITECGEILDQFKKAKFYNRFPDFVNVLEEAGDLSWYLALAANESLGFKAELHSMYTLPNRLPKFTQKEIVDLLRQKTQKALSQFLVLSSEHKSERAAYREIGILIDDICAHLQVPIQLVWESNISKLAKRYGSKFNDVGANLRSLSDERADLEDHLSLVVKGLTS